MYRGNVFVALFIVDWNKAGGVRRQAGRQGYNGFSLSFAFWKSRDVHCTTDMYTAADKTRLD